MPPSAFLRLILVVLAASPESLLRRFAAHFIRQLAQLACNFEVEALRRKVSAPACDIHKIFVLVHDAATRRSENIFRFNETR